MSQWNQYLYKTALNGLYCTGLHKALSSLTRGQGIIFTLHQVNDTKPQAFSPNSILKITPDFLEDTIKTVQKNGYDIISLNEVKGRLNNPKQHKPFAVFTFDDGYKDNRDIALPVLEKYNIPMTLYIVSEYSSHRSELWWLILEHLVRENTSLKDPFEKDRIHQTATISEKYAAFESIYWRLRYRNQPKQREIIRQMAEDYQFDCEHLTRDLIMGWDELRELQKHPLVSLGAHTKHHYAVKLLPDDKVKDEIVAGVKHMQEELGETPVHFAYPYGDKTSAGHRDFQIAKDVAFETAVTTRKGVVHADHKNHLTALPRISLNGEYQKQRYVETYISGLPFYIRNKGRKLDIT